MEVENEIQKSDSNEVSNDSNNSINEITTVEHHKPVICEALEVEGLFEIFFTHINMYELKIPKKYQVLRLTLIAMLLNVSSNENLTEDKDERFYRQLLTDNLDVHVKKCNDMDDTIVNYLNQDQFEQIFNAFQLVISILRTENEDDEEGSGSGSGSD